MDEQYVVTSFKEKFQLDQLAIYETDDWVLSVRPGQLTLGSMVLSVKGYYANFASLPEVMANQMQHMFQMAEKLAKELFGADKINMLCLMMQDPLVHFHILPRYAESVTFAGHTWVDNDWPKPPDIKPVTSSSEILHKIVESCIGFIQGK